MCWTGCGAHTFQNVLRHCTFQSGASMDSWTSSAEIDYLIWRRSSLKPHAQPLRALANSPLGSTRAQLPKDPEFDRRQHGISSHCHQHLQPQNLISRNLSRLSLTAFDLGSVILITLSFLALSLVCFSAATIVSIDSSP